MMLAILASGWRSPECVPDRVGKLSSFRLATDGRLSAADSGRRCGCAIFVAPVFAAPQEESAHRDTDEGRRRARSIVRRALAAATWKHAGGGTDGSTARVHERDPLPPPRP